jgi:hypothetical protein
MTACFIASWFNGPDETELDQSFEQDIHHLDAGIQAVSKTGCCQRASLPDFCQ